MIALGMAAIILFVAFTRRGTASSSSMGTAVSRSASGFYAGHRKVNLNKPLPSFVKDVITNKSPSKDDLLMAADQADEAEFPQLAAVLRSKSESAAQLIPSPWKDVTSADWTTFCRAMIGPHKPSSVNPKGFYGMFQLSVRRLCDLGIMSNAHSRNLKLADDKVVRIWEGRWIVPRDRFLSDPKMQYAVFTKSMELYRNIIAEKYQQVIGLQIADKPATLSGLLALAHTAGSEGLHKWLVSAEIRQKFSWVTTAFDLVNGIF